MSRWASSPWVANSITPAVLMSSRPTATQRSERRRGRRSKTVRRPSGSRRVVTSPGGLVIEEQAARLGERNEDPTAVDPDPVAGAEPGAGGGDPSVDPDPALRDPIGPRRAGSRRPPRRGASGRVRRRRPRPAPPRPRASLPTVALDRGRGRPRLFPAAPGLLPSGLLPSGLLPVRPPPVRPPPIRRGPAVPGVPRRGCPPSARAPPARVRFHPVSSRFGPDPVRSGRSAAVIPFSPVLLHVAGSPPANGGGGASGAESSREAVSRRDEARRPGRARPGPGHPFPAPSGPGLAAPVRAAPVRVVRPSAPRTRRKGSSVAAVRRRGPAFGPSLRRSPARRCMRPADLDFGLGPDPRPVRGPCSLSFAAIRPVFRDFTLGRVRAGRPLSGAAGSRRPRSPAHPFRSPLPGLRPERDRPAARREPGPGEAGPRRS